MEKHMFLKSKEVAETIFIGKVKQENIDTLLINNIQECVLDNLKKGSNLSYIKINAIDIFEVLEVGNRIRQETLKTLLSIVRPQLQECGIRVKFDKLKNELIVKVDDLDDELPKAVTFDTQCSGENN